MSRNDFIIQKGARDLGRWITTSLVILLSLLMLISVNIADVRAPECGERSDCSVPGSRSELGDLTGTYSANDGGTYYVRQTNDTVGWVGLSSDIGRQWTNVFKGTIQGDQITGEWAGVPLGSTNDNGILTLNVEVTPNDQVLFHRTDVSGGFSGSEWNKTK